MAGTRSTMPNGLAGLLACLTASERAELDALLTGRTPLWRPLPGPQRTAYDSVADVLFYGGAAGGGKTDLLLGLAATQHRRTVVFRREYAQLTALADRAQALYGGAGRYHAQSRTWRLGGDRTIEFAAVQRPGDERRFQGRPHDLKAFDELTHFLEAQFRFLVGWLRSTDPAQRRGDVAPGNPPTDAAGEWVIRFWAPWLDPQAPRPAAPGELRWFVTTGGVDEEVEGPGPVAHAGGTLTPQSRTFVRARVEDNPYLMAAGYRETLQSLPEALRVRLLEGSFAAGLKDDPWQVVPTAWIRAAQRRWHDGPAPGPLTAVGVDVARGGADRTVLSPRHGAWFARQQVHPGAETPDGPHVAALVARLLTGTAVANVDVIGVGGSVVDHLRGHGLAVQALNAAAGTTARDRTGELGFANRRSEWWWRLREALDPDHGEGLALPDDRGLLAELAAPRWKLAARGIQVEGKDDVRRRLGRSPDRADAITYALVPPPAPVPGLANDRELIRENPWRL